MPEIEKSYENSDSYQEIEVKNDLNADQKDARYKLLAETPIRKLFWLQSYPNILAALYNQTVNACMVIILSRYRPTLTTAFSFSNPFQLVCRSFALLVGSGTNNTVSYYFGKKDYRKVEEAMCNGLLLCFVSTAFLVIVFYPSIPYIIPLFGTPESVAPFTILDSNILMCASIIPNLALWANGILRAQGSPKIVMYGLLLGASLGLLAAYIFCIVLNWGIAGFASAYMVSPLCNFLFALPFILRGKHVAVHFKFTKINKILIDIIKRGCSAGLSWLTGVVLIIIMNEGIVKLTYGKPSSTPEYTETEVISAARAAVSSITNVVMNVATTLAINATLPLANFARGAGLWDRFRKVNIYAIFVTFGITFGLCALFLALSTVIPSIFFVNSADKHAMSKIMIIYLIGRAFCSPAISIVELFQSIELNLVATIVSFLRKLFVISALLLIVMFSTDNIWMLIGTFPIGDAISTILSLIIIFCYKNKLVLTKKAVAQKLAEHETARNTETVIISENDDFTEVDENDD